MMSQAVVTVNAGILLPVLAPAIGAALVRRAYPRTF